MPQGGSGGTTFPGSCPGKRDSGKERVLEARWVAYSGRVDKTRDILTAAREQVRHTIDHLDEARADLEAVAAGLRLPDREEEADASLAGLYELDAVIRCGVHDHLKPLLSSLRGLLRSEAEEQP